jgi:hypothetical protein
MQRGTTPSCCCLLEQRGRPEEQQKKRLGQQQLPAVATWQPRAQWQHGSGSGKHPAAGPAVAPQQNVLLLPGHCKHAADLSMH